jgi:outer membrane receptor protein involved in Fe transport
MTPEDSADAHLERRSSGRWWAPSALIVLLLSAGPASLGAAPASPGCARPTGDRRSCEYAGRPLVDVLNDLRARGLKLIFSSDLVRPDMVVEDEPPVAAPRQILGRLLAPFGLEARDGPAGTVLVVRATGAERTGAGDAGQPGGGREDRPVPSRPMLREQVQVGASPAGEPAPMATLKQDDLERLPAVGDDAARSIAWLPGMAAADKSARLSIRGGGSDEALIVLDGLEIDEPFHLQDFLAFSSIVDARAIGRMDVLTGIFPAEYGDRTSGVIDLSIAEPADTDATRVGLSLINASVLSGGRLSDGGGSWLMSARSWYPDAVLDIVDPGGEDISPSYNDLLGKVQVQLPGGSLLSAHLLASRDDLDYLADLKGARAEAGDDHLYTWINWKTPWTARLYAQTLVSSSRAARSRNGRILEAAGGVAQVVDARSYASFGLKQDWIFTAGERSSLKWGFDARQLEAEYAYRSHVEQTDPLAAGGASALSVIDRDLSLDPSGTELGAYVAGRFRVFSPLTIEVGVRRDRQTLTGEAETSPRVNLAWAPGDRSVLRAGWGRLHQPQGINELQIEDGVLDFFPAQRAERWEVDFDHLFAGGLKLGVSAYVKSMTRLRPRYENLFNPIQLFPEAEPDRVRIAPGRAAARGVEIELGMDRGRPLSWRASYALASAQDQVDGAWVPRSWDQRHTLSLSLNYRRGEKWDVSLAGVFHTGWPTTDVRAVQVQNPDGSLVIQPILGPRNGLRYPSYHRLDLKVTRRFELDGGTLGLYLDVTNLYGRDNVCCVQDLQYLPQADGSVRVDRTEGYWLRQVPVVGLTWDF